MVQNEAAVKVHGRAGSRAGRQALPSLFARVGLNVREGGGRAGGNEEPLLRTEAGWHSCTLCAYGQ